MKKSASALLLFTLILSAIVPSFAQKRQPVTGVTQTNDDLSDFARFGTIKAVSDGFGVYIGWEMLSETSNMGFNVYRLGKGGPVLVNPELIPGAAIRSPHPTAYSEQYEIFDAQGGVSSTYLIRSIAVDGRQLDTAPIYVRLIRNFQAETGKPKSYFTATVRRNGDLRSQRLELPAELQTIVTSAAREPNLSAQQHVVSLPGAKIVARQTGIYRVTRGELQNAGFDVNSNPANWQLYMEGNEQAIIVEPTGQYIEFYGRGLDVPESDSRMYYLVNEGIAGKRMLPKQLRPLGVSLSTNYRATVTKKERLNYNYKILNGDAENYFGRTVGNGADTVENFTVTGIDPSASNAVVTISVQGIFGVQHSVNATLNGNFVGQIGGFGQNLFTSSFTVPVSFLVEGTNSLSLRTAASFDSDYFDSVSVSFSRKYKADGNQVSFYTPGYRRNDIIGFSSQSVTLLDTTYDGEPSVIINPNIVQENSSWTIKMPADRAAVFYAVEDGAKLTSPSVTYNTPSSYSSSSTPTDYVIISYSNPEFLAAAENWANYRRSTAGGGFSVRVVDVADIYDEYGYGVLGWKSLNEFLRHAQQAWGTRYTLLLGDASYDPRNYEGFGNNDYIPTATIQLLLDETGSDDALADFNHDGLADIAIGRISARDTFAINNALAKTRAFETRSNQSLNRGVVLAYGLPDGYDFEGMSYSIGYQLPDGTPKTFVSYGLPAPNSNTPDPTAKDSLLTALNTGPILVNYSGHGSAGLWNSSSFLGSTDIPSLTNNSTPSVYTMLTCLNGYFFRPRVEDDSIAEHLVKAPSGGAAAAWASTSDTTPDIQGIMAERFYNRAGIGQIRRMGDLVKDAKSVIAGSDVGYSWVLLGDPALQVR